MKSLDLLSLSFRLTRSSGLRVFSAAWHKETSWKVYREMQLPHQHRVCPRFSVDMGHVSFVFEHYPKG